MTDLTNEGLGVREYFDRTREELSRIGIPPPVGERGEMHPDALLPDKDVAAITEAIEALDIAGRVHDSLVSAREAHERTRAALEAERREPRDPGKTSPAFANREPRSPERPFDSLVVPVAVAVGIWITVGVIAIALGAIALGEKL